MKAEEIKKILQRAESPLKKQLLLVALISRTLEDRGKDTPVVIGGCALSYYTREVYFTADIDLAYADRKALNAVLREFGFSKRGRYWVSHDLDMAVEAPVSTLAGEDSPIEVVEFDEGWRCKILGLEDLIIDRMNACKHWKSEIDCEMVELLLRKYGKEVDWSYLKTKAALPENDLLPELTTLRTKTRRSKRKR